MAIPDTSWVITDEDDAIYGEARGYEADVFVLSKKARAQAFVSAKKSTAGIFPLLYCLTVSSVSILIIPIIYILRFHYFFCFACRTLL